MTIKNIEQLILNAINGLEFQNKLEDVLSDYGEEINHYRLSTQLLILKTKFADSNEKNHISSNKLYEKQCWCNICTNKLYKKQYWCTNKFLPRNNFFKIFVSPAMNVVIEQSTRIKNCLRSTMSQGRLNIIACCFQYLKKKLTK